MKKILNIFVVFFFLLLSSCSDETTIFEEPNNNLLLETNDGTLANSVNFSNVGLVEIIEPASGKSQSSNKPRSTDNYPLALVAEIVPPSNNSGIELAASHVDLVDDYVYISYNTAGITYYGAIDVVDISDPYTPSLTSRLYFESSDLNAIVFDEGYIYVAGGTDAEKSAVAPSSSFVAKIPVSDGIMDISNGVEYGYQEGFVATDVLVNGNNVFITSGEDGYITSFDKTTLEIINSSPYTDLRSLSKTQNGLAVLDGDFGVRFLDNTLNEISSFEVNGDFAENEKRTISVYGDRIAIAKGTNGADIYNLTTGVLETNLAIGLTPNGVDTADIVTNAVAFNDDVLLLANGGAGLSLSENQNNIELVGVLGLEGSINYVASMDDYIFSASGKSGLQIIKMNRTPDSLSDACLGLSGFSGSSLNIAVDQEEDYYNAIKRLNDITVAGSLSLCGYWYTTVGDIVVEDEALMEVNGNLICYNYKDIIVKAGATLRIQGTLVNYGNLILEENARLEFIGTLNTVYNYGNVVVDETAQVSGNFVDAFNKF